MGVCVGGEGLCVLVGVGMCAYVSVYSCLVFSSSQNFSIPPDKRQIPYSIPIPGNTE